MPIILDRPGVLGDTFASVSELAAMLGVSIEDDDEKALLVLQAATGAIQREAKHRIFLIAGDEKRLHGSWANRMLLPEPPVIDVEEVSITYPGLETETITGFSCTRHGHLRRGTVLEPSVPGWGGPDSEVFVKYTHGFAEIPGDIKGLCLQIAMRLFGGSGGISSETIGGYSVSYSGDGAGVELTESERRICSAYWPVIE